MSGRYKKRSSKKLPPFVPLTWDLLNSQAYINLTNSAGKALPYFLGKVKLPHGDPGKHLAEFSFSYTEARQYGFANGTHHRVISELMDKGFIDPVDKGGLKGGGLTSSYFKLSERWRKYGAQDFVKVENWRSFKPRFKNKRNSKNGNLQHQKRKETGLA